MSLSFPEATSAESLKEGVAWRQPRGNDCEVLSGCVGCHLRRASFRSLAKGPHKQVSVCVYVYIYMYIDR